MRVRGEEEVAERGGEARDLVAMGRKLATVAPNAFAGSAYLLQERQKGNLLVSIVSTARHFAKRS